MSKFKKIFRNLALIVTPVLLSGCLQTSLATLQPTPPTQQRSFPTTAVQTIVQGAEGSKPDAKSAQSPSPPTKIEVNRQNDKATRAIKNDQFVKLQDIRPIVGKLNVPKYNAVKTAAALVGKSVDFTLVHPNGGLTETDFLTANSLRKSGIFFTCKDMPNGIPKGKASYSVLTKVSNFTVVEGVEGDSMGAIELERCKN